MSEQPNPNSGDIDLKTITDGKVPSMRLDDPDHAFATVGILKDAQELRAINETKVKGMLDGNPPYSPTKLRQTAQSYRANVNFREAEAIHSAAVTPYYDLFAEAPYYADVQLDQENPNIGARKSKTVTLEFDRMLRKYDGFDYNIQLAIGDLVDYGKGFVFWENNKDWWFQSVNQDRVMVPDGTPTNVDALEIIVVRQSYRVHELYKMIKNRDAANSAGWNVDQVMLEIETAFPEAEQSTDRISRMRMDQQMLRNQDLYQSVRSSTVEAAHIFVKEFDGSISHLIISETAPRKTPEGGEVPKKFMFKKRGRFENFRQVVGAMFYDIGDGTWHSVKGLLIKMYPFIEIKNRLTCSYIDNAFLGNSILVQPTTAKSSIESALQQIGPLTILKHGFNIQQWGLAGRLEESLAVERTLDNRLSSNIGQYRTTVQREDGNPETATKVRADVAKETTLTKGAVNRMYSQLDFVYEEIYRRVVAENVTDDNGGPGTMALEFRKRCKDKGVLLKELRKVIHVRAFRNIGNGSPFLRQQSIGETQRLIPMMNDQGRQNWLDDAIAVSTNHEMVERYNPKTDPNVEGDDHVNAAHDAAAMKNGVRPRITDKQDHAIFAQVYLEEAATELQLLKAGKDPREVLGFLDMIGPAIAKRLRLISNDHPKAGEVKTMIAQWKQIAKIADQLRGKVANSQQQQADAQQNGQRVLTDEQIKMIQFQNDERRKDLLVQNDINRQNAKTQQDLQLKEEKTNQQLQIKAREAQ